MDITKLSSRYINVYIHITYKTQRFVEGEGNKSEGGNSGHNMRTGWEIGWRPQRTISCIVCREISNSSYSFVIWRNFQQEDVFVRRPRPRVLGLHMVVAELCRESPLMLNVSHLWSGSGMCQCSTVTGMGTQLATSPSPTLPTPVLTP